MTKFNCLGLNSSCIYLKINIKHRIATILHSSQHVKCIPLNSYHVNSDDFYLSLIYTYLTFVPMATFSY